MGAEQPGSTRDGDGLETHDAHPEKRLLGYPDNYLQARWNALQLVMPTVPLQFMVIWPAGLAPMPLIEFLRAALAMNFARSCVTIVASPPARTQDDFASADTGTRYEPASAAAARIGAYRSSRAMFDSFAC
jgi:hypothetical protein